MTIITRPPLNLPKKKKIKRKPAWNALPEEYYAKDGKKKCRICDKVKSVDDFSKGNNVDGRYAWCKKCKSARYKQRRKELARERQR